MGVQPPEVGDFQGGPRTPEGIQGHDSEDDLYSDTGTTTNTTPFPFDRETFFRSILPALPAKGVYEDFLGVDSWDAPNEKRYCGKCFEDVMKDLKKLAEVVDSVRNERDAARKETEVLKKEVAQLKKLVKEKEDSEKGDVTINIANGNETIDMRVRNKSYIKENDFISNEKYSRVKKLGILSFSISLPKDKSLIKSKLPDTAPEVRAKKTIAELRREFFAKEFESQQKTFTTYNYLEVKPEEKKETFRSKLNIRVKPKKKISELISKLTSKIGAPKVIPDPEPLCMFQRFEKTKTVWVSECEGN